MDKIKKINKNKLFVSIIGIVSTVSIASSIAIPLVSNRIMNINGHNSYSKVDNNINKDNNASNNDNSSLLDANSSNVKPLVPSVSNFENAKLSTKQGPIVFWGDTIRSLDWFGAERWKVDLTTLEVKNNENNNAFPTTYGTDVKRSWMNWELDRKNNKIWILSNIAAPKNGKWTNDDKEFKHQYLISLSTEDGSLQDKYRLNRNNGRNDVYRNVSIFSDGTPFVYGLGFSINRNWGSGFGYSFLGEKLDSTTNTMKNILNDEVGKKFPQVAQENKEGMDYFFNVIPIAKNRNLFFTVQRSNIRSSNHFSSDKPFEKTTVINDVSKMDMSITAILLDDNLKEIQGGNNQWSNGNLVKIIKSANDKFKNKYTFPQRDWYTLLDGRVVTIIYDTLLIFDPSNPDNPVFNEYKIGNDGDWVESYTFDTDENIFFKLYKSTKIEKLTLDKNKNGNKHNKSLYYDIQNSNEDIRKHAESFSIYNVSGYSGQIMMINSYFDGYNSSNDLPLDNATNQYGLAAAIISNASNQLQGDTKGLLNTEKAFQKSADFQIDQNVLNAKLPSEITRSDLKLLNNAFFTKRTDIENNQLKYNPFVKTEMDDSSKKLTVTTYLDQIPWFVNTNEMPKDIKPLKIEKTYHLNVNITDRFTWKKSDKDDYDFKNTLPSKVTIDDIKRLSPLVSTISSKFTIIEGENYPKIDYKIETQDDTTGKIKIVATYSYLPMDTQELKSNIKQYKTEQEYTIFKNGDAKKFSFVTNSNSSQTTADINNIPALKELKEANLFPSYFDKLNNKQEFLKFIDVNRTAGYPLEKMDISVVANDNNGTLEVIVDPKKYDSTLDIQKITYTGLNKKDTYRFMFDINPSKFNKKLYRPSDITDEILFKNFITYSGFDSSDLDVSLNPNNSIGNLTVSISLIVNYPSDVLLSSGFTLKNNVYVQNHTITGFKTDKEFNNEYQLNFKNDLDASLLKIKELTPATIKSKIENTNNGGLTIGSNKYNDIYDLVNLFISSKGVKIPNIEKGNSNITLNMFVNNSGGEITFSVTFTSLDGYPNSLTFIQKFTGFAKGNDVVTDDVLTFKDSNQLQLTEKDLISKKPSEVEKELNGNDKIKMIYKFLSGTPTGSYKSAIDSGKFELEINADDNYGTLTINIKFSRNEITNASSLLEYSQTFNGFNHF